MAKQIRRQIGKYLKELRESKNMILSEVVAELSFHRIKCSHVHLSRIEHGKSNFRTEILAGLGLVYGISTDEILYRSDDHYLGEEDIAGDLGLEPREMQAYIKQGAFPAKWSDDKNCKVTHKEYLKWKTQAAKHQLNNTARKHKQKTKPTANCNPQATR
jgi:transcriptional regulator with XRE-family HTH domain